MDASEIFELGLIPAMGAAAWWLASALPGRIDVGKLLLWAAALLLLQSLLRDLWLLAKVRRNVNANPPRVARCMCVESMVGMTGIVIGIFLFSFGIGKPLVMERWAWSLFVVLVLGTGFFVKDYVLEARPWRLRRDKHHVNIIVKWRK